MLTPAQSPEALGAYVGNVTAPGDVIAWPVRSTAWLLLLPLTAGLLGNPLSALNPCALLKLSVGAVLEPGFSATIDSARALAVMVVRPVGVNVELAAAEVPATDATSSGFVTLTLSKATMRADAPPPSVLTVMLGAVTPVWKRL